MPTTRATKPVVLPQDAIDIWNAVMGNREDVAPYGAAYVRVSSDFQKDNTSLGTQLRALLQQAADEEVYIRLEHVFWEVHTGEELWERPELTRMRGLFKARPFGVVYFYSVDRFAREPFYAELVIDEGKRCKIKVDFHLQKFDDTPEGGLMRHVAEYVAKKELYAIRERTARGKKARLDSGKPYGSGYPPYGYRWLDGPNERRERHAAYAIDPKTAPIVQRIFREIASGKGMRHICRDLMRDGIPTPRGKRIWGTGTLSVMLQTDYTGTGWANRYMTVRDDDGRERLAKRPRSEWVKLPEGAMPRLVEPQVYEAALQVKNTNRALAARNNQAPEQFLLRGGFLRCGQCGGSMVSRVYRTFGNYAIYMCHGNAEMHQHPTDGRRAKRANVNASQVDALVWRNVCSLINDAAFLERTLSQLRSSDRTFDNLSAIDNRLRGIAGEILNYAEALGQAKNPLTVATLTAQMDRLAEQQTALQAERQAVLQQGSVIARAQAHIEGLRELYAELGPALQSMPYQLRQRTLLALGIKVTVYPRDKGSRALPRMEMEASIPIANVDSEKYLFYSLSQSTSAISLRWQLQGAVA